jgi:hypothetical protein
MPERVRLSPSGKDLADIGGSGEPLSNVFFVDKDTAVDPASQTGAATAPFDTMADAVAAIVAAGRLGAIYVTSGDYTAQGPIIVDGEDGSILILGLGSDPTLFDSIEWDVGGTGTGRIINCDANNELDIGCSVTEGSANFFLQNCTLPGGVAVTGGGDLNLWLASIDREDSVGPVTVENVRFAENYNFTGVVTTGGQFYMRNCVCGVAVTASTISAEGSDFSGNISVGAGFVYLNDCTVGPVTITADEIRATATRLGATTLTIASIIDVDAFSYQSAMEAGTELAGAKLQWSVIGDVGSIVQQATDTSATITPGTDYGRVCAPENFFTANRTTEIDATGMLANQVIVFECYDTGGNTWAIDNGAGVEFTFDGATRLAASFVATAADGPVILNDVRAL